MMPAGRRGPYKEKSKTSQADTSGESSLTKYSRTTLPLPTNDVNATALTAESFQTEYSKTSSPHVFGDAGTKRINSLGCVRPKKYKTKQGNTSETSLGISHVLAKSVSLSENVSVENEPTNDVNATAQTAESFQTEYSKTSSSHVFGAAGTKGIDSLGRVRPKKYKTKQGNTSETSLGIPHVLTKSVSLSENVSVGNEEEKSNHAMVQDAAKRRFANLSTDDIAEKRAKLTPRNTLKANGKAERALRNYLTETGVPDIKFENLTAEMLAETLSTFYFNARTVDGQMYKSSSLEGFRHGLNRFLQGPPNNRNIDIIRDPEFRGANDAFKSAMRELKSAGKGEVEHYPQISDADLKKLYDNMNTETPYQLLMKVQFDIRFYFFRRGAGNMHSMKKDTFVVKKDPNTGLKYVTKKVDKLNKNQREQDKESYSAFMPESPGDPKCPVASFEKMLGLLHPQCDSLWQRPRDFFRTEDTTWFYNQPVGANALGIFMKRLSVTHKLSQVYSNHSIRVTGATLLSRQQYGSKQIMSVTGHKSDSSLAVYQRVSDTEKLHMGLSLNAALGTSGQVRVPSSELSKDSGLGEHLLREFYRLWKLGQLCDVCLQLPNGTRLNAHRLVLAAHSEYFHTLICQAMKQNTQEIPVIAVDSDISMISNLLQYMYTGEISVSSSGIEELCHQAEKYSMSRLVELCKKLKDVTQVQPEAADRTSDSSLKHEHSVPMRWEYNSQDVPQHTSSIYHSELGAPVSNISQSRDTVQETRRVDVSNISHSGDTVQAVSRVVLGAPVSNIIHSGHTVQENSRVDLGIVKQEMTVLPNSNAGCERSSKSTFSSNAIMSTTSALSSSHVTLPQNIELDRDRLENIVIKREANAGDDQHMVFIEQTDLNLRPDSGMEHSGKSKQLYDSPSVHKYIKTASGPVTFKTEDTSDTPIQWVLGGTL